MIETKEVQVADRTYYITTFSGTTGLSYLNKLKSIVGPSLATLFSGEEDPDGDVVMESKALQEAVNALFENMDKGNAEALIKEMVDKYVLNSNKQPLVFDAEFSANYHYLALLIKEIIVLNYGSLFFLKDGFGAPSANSL